MKELRLHRVKYLAQHQAAMEEDKKILKCQTYE